MNEKTIKMDFGGSQQNVSIDMSSLNDQQLQFVIREFMKAFALKLSHVDSPPASFHPTNFFDQIYLQDNGVTAAVLWVYVNNIWQSMPFDL